MQKQLDSLGSILLHHFNNQWRQLDSLIPSHSKLPATVIIWRSGNRTCRKYKTLCIYATPQDPWASARDTISQQGCLIITQVCSPGTGWSAQPKSQDPTFPSWLQSRSKQHSNFPVIFGKAMAGPSMYMCTVAPGECQQWIKRSQGWWQWRFNAASSD